MRIHGRWVWWCLMSKSLPWIQCHHGPLLQVSAAHPKFCNKIGSRSSGKLRHATKWPHFVSKWPTLVTTCEYLFRSFTDAVLHVVHVGASWGALGDSETLAHGPQQKDLTTSPWRSEGFLRWCLQLSSNDVFHSIWMFTQLHSIPPHFVPFHSVRCSLNFIPLHSISLRLILFLSQFNAFYSMDRIPFRSVRSVPIHSLLYCCIMSTAGETCSWRQWLGAFIVGQECWTRSVSSNMSDLKKNSGSRWSFSDDTNHRLNHAHLPVCTWTQNSSHTRGPFEVAMIVWRGTRWYNMCEQEPMNDTE